MTKFRIGIAIVLTSLLLTSAASAETYRFNRWFPAQHLVQVELTKWAEDVAKATEGRMQIEFTATTLAPPVRQFDLVKDGGADFALVSHVFTPARFPLTDVIQLPFVTKSAETLSVAYWRVHERFLEKGKEHDGVKLITLFTHGPGQIFSGPKPIDKIDDLKGYKMVVGGGVQAEILKTLDAAIIAVPATSAFELLSRGTADGISLTTMGIQAFNLGGVLKHAVVVPGGLYNGSFGIVMNQQKWDALSPKDQQALMQLSGETLARRSGQKWDEADRLARPLLEARGVTFTVASAEFQASLRAKLAGLEEAWINGPAKTKGIDGKAALDFVKAENR